MIMQERLLGTTAANFVAERYGARAGAVQLVGAGEWSQAYAFSLDGHEAIIRFGRYGEDFAKDAVMGESHPAALPVPKVLELGETPTGFFAVSERRHGLFLDALDGSQMRAALPSLLSALDALRQADLTGTSGYGNWTPERQGPHASWAEALLAIDNDSPRIGDWRKALEQSRVGIESFDVGLEKLNELAPRLPDHRQLIHNDLLNRNVLVNDGEITAVLDWGNASYGDALYDAAWLLYWWPWYPQWTDMDIRAELASHWKATTALPADFDDRLVAYQLHIGLDHLAYTAAMGRWDDLDRNDSQVRELLAVAGA